MEKIEFTVDGKTYVLPTFVITSGEMRKLRRLNNLDAWYTLLEWKADPELIEASDKLPMQEVLDLLKRWNQGLSLGESSGSSS